MITLVSFFIYVYIIATCISLSVCCTKCRPYFFVIFFYIAAILVGISWFSYTNIVASMYDSHTFFCCGYSALNQQTQKIDARNIRKELFDGASIHVTILSSSPGQRCKVDWNVPSPTSKDLIGITCGDRLWKDGDVLDEMHVSGTSVVFPPIPDIRCEYLVQYLRMEPNQLDMTIIAETKVQQSHIPSQGQSSFTDKSDEMRISFVSKSNAKPYVKWGYESGTYPYMETGTSFTYRADQMCNAPATNTGPHTFIHPGFFHRVILKQLPKQTRVYYIYGNSIDGWSNESTFVSRTGDGDSETKFLMFADQNVLREQGKKTFMLSSIANDAKTYNAFLLFPGDISYAQGQGYYWDAWAESVANISAHIPFEMGVGNHDYSYVGIKKDPSGLVGGWHPGWTFPFTNTWDTIQNDSYGECGVPYAARFAGTGNGNKAFWYSFNEGNVHVTMFSTEHDWRKGSKQYNWIENDLRRVNRTKTPWLIVSMHRAMYTTVNDPKEVKGSLELRKHIDPLLEKYNVNAVFCGHIHTYERSCPVRNGQCHANGTIHFVVGSGGAGPYTYDFTHPKATFTQIALNDYGYVRVNAKKTTMHVEFVKVEDTNAYVWDSVTLSKKK